MDNVIIYGLGKNFESNRKYIEQEYRVVAYCDRNDDLKDKYPDKWISPDQVSSKLQEADYVLVTFQVPLGIEETENLCFQLDIKMYSIKFLAHEMRRNIFESFIDDSQKKTRRFLNDKQMESLDYVVQNDLFHREFRIKGGRNHRDKSFFIIRYGLGKVGLFTAYNVFAGHIKYAIDRGYIPVIDMQNYPNIYLEPDEYGFKNAWELFFVQPSGFSIEEAYSGANVVVSDLTLIYDRPVLSEEYFYNINGELDKWRRISHEYMKIRPDLLEDIQSSFRDLKNNSKVLGVYCRGTDYVKMRYPGHPIQPDPMMVLNDVKEKVKKWGCEKIFVGTEDKDIAELFRNEFGNRYITNKREFVEYKSGLTCAIEIKRENDKYLQGKEYLTTMVMCSMCDCIIASRANGSLGFYMLSKGWEHEKVYFLGEYPDTE